MLWKLERLCCEKWQTNIGLWRIWLWVRDIEAWWSISDDAQSPDQMEFNYRQRRFCLSFHLNQWFLNCQNLLKEEWFNLVNVTWVLTNMKEYKGHEINANIIMAYSVQSFLNVPIFLPMSCFNVVYDAACIIVCIVMLHFCKKKKKWQEKTKQPDTVNCCLHACFPLILENTCLHPAEWHKAICLMVNPGKSL